MSTIRVDTVSEYTSANGVAIDSVTLKDGAVYPSSADGGALGAAANEWSDIYIADSGVVYFGNDQEIKITHVADTGLNLKHTATADDKPIVLTLQTGETDLAADDVIGKIAFQAPDEGTGTDAILVSAAIQARAEGDHSSSSNATSIDFMTGASEAAAKKLSITSAGHFIPGTDNTYDIGTSSLEFKDGYFDGTLYCDTLNLAGTDHTSLASGLTVADQWRLTADFVGTNADISANLEQVDTGGQGSLGSAMTESSGVFTFPSTGFWLVMCTGSFNTASADNCSIGVFVTTDNSSYTQVAHLGSTNKGSAGSSGDTKTVSTMVDVTNVSNVKVKFVTASMAGSSQINGSSSLNHTTFTFLRFGDT